MKKKSCSRWRGPNRGLQTTQRQPKPPQNKDCGKLSHINTPVYMLIKLYCTEKNWWLETLSIPGVLMDALDGRGSGDHLVHQSRVPV